MPPEEWIKTIVGFGTSTLGFFVALLVNSYVEVWRDRRSHCMMLKAIKAEAASNRVILEESFMAFYREGVVIREFLLGAAIQSCASPLFIKHSKPAEIETLNTYVRNLKLANGYREKAEYFRIVAKGKASQEWLDAIVDNWGNNLKLCRGSIEQVLNLAEN